MGATLDTRPETDATSHALLCAMREHQVAANRAEMARARAMTALFQQLSADFEARRADDPHFTAPPLTEVVTETQPVTGQTTGRIRADLEAVLLMDAYAPWLAELCDDGRLDLYRAKPVTDALKDDLADHKQARARFLTRIKRWFDKAAHACPDLLNKTIAQIRNHVHYVVTKVLAGEFDERFKKRHTRRRVSSHPTGDGMAALTTETDQVSVRLAEHHLDLLAREARAAGDPRTLDQLRADISIDLLTGRHTNTNTDTGTGGAHGSIAGRWARPIINVTVPIHTLMGLSDEPGRMGEETLPASLVRHIAADPTSTWHRMLTDPARGCLELSTSSYRPTGPIWRQVIAAQPTCFAPTCDRPATESELDHRVPWPQGPTTTSNLGPGCPRDHRAKHAKGASLRKHRDGTLRYTTRAGLTHLITPAEQPGCDDPHTGRLWQRLLDSHPTTAELLDALDLVRHHTHHVDDLEHEARRRAQHADDLRRSYPDATAEDITEWVFGDTQAPPLNHRTDPFWDQPPGEPELSPLATRAGTVPSAQL